MRSGWTREQLAVESGMSWSAIAQLEAGRRKDVRLATVSALAEALGTSLDYLGTGRSSVGMFRHQLLGLSGTADFASAVAPFLLEGIARSEAVLAVTSGPKADLLRDALGPAGASVTFIEREGWYRTGEAALTGYRAFIESSLGGGAHWARVVGEPSGAAEWTEDPVKLARYEATIDLALGPLPATLLCVYDWTVADPRTLDAAKSTHAETVSGTGAAPNPSYRHPDAILLAGDGGST